MKRRLGRSPRPGRLGAAGLAFVAALAPAAETPKASPSPPVLEQFIPLAVTAGTATPVSGAGRFDPWPISVWTDAPGLVVKPLEAAARFSVDVGPGVAPGPHLVRIYNEAGASALRFLVVTTQPETGETEPNDDVAKATPIARLPVTVNARLGKGGDVDSYAVKLAAGQTLIASVEAYVLASPVDAVLRLVDSAGRQVAWNHDDGRSLDPRLVWTAAQAGTYFVQVFGFAHPATADVKFAGSDATVYRLHLSGGPYVSHTVPLGIQRGAVTSLRVEGWNLGAVAHRTFSVDPRDLAPTTASLAWSRPEFENGLTLPVGDGPESTEADRAKAKSDAAPSAPFAITGCIERAGEEDRFAFAAAKGDKLVFEVQSAVLGFPLDAWLAIRNGAGKELARSDDGATADPVLEWTAPGDGPFFAVVGNVLHRGGPNHVYRLGVRPARPALEATVAQSGFTVEPGKSTKIKVSVKRLEGFTGKLTTAIADLPAGVTAAPVELADSAKELTVELAAAADAAPFSGPFRIGLKGESPTAHAVVHPLVSTELNNGVPQGFRQLAIRRTEQLWLTVLRPPAPATPAAPAGPGK